MKTDKSSVLNPSLELQIFYQMYSKRKLGVVVTSLITSINFLEINCFLYESVREFYGDDYPDSVFRSVHQLTRYLYMLTYTDLLGTTVYTVLRYFAALFNISYLVLFFIMRHLTRKGTSTSGVERFFELFNTYFIQVMLLPSCEILFRDLFCDQKSLGILGEQCLTKTQIANFSFALIATIAIVLMTLVTVFYSLNGIYDKKNYYSGQNQIWEALLAFLRILLPLLLANNGSGRTYILVYLAINLAFGLLLLAYFMKFFPYNKLYIEYFTLGWLSFYFSQALASFLFAASDDSNFNPDYLTLIFFVISIPANFFLYDTLKKRLIGKTNASSTSELLRQIQAILQLKRVEKLNSDEELHFRGLLSLHKESCTNLKCFCKTEELFDPKKNREFEPAKWGNIKPLILKYYVRLLLEEAISKRSNDIDLLISYSEFLFQKFRNTHLALYQIMKILGSHKYLYPTYRFRIYKLQQRIIAYINARNLESLEKALEIENVILVEEQLEKVLQGMRKIILNSLGFWGYLYNKEIDLNKLKVLAEEMDTSVETTTKLWIPLRPYLYKQKKIMYYYNWFLKDIMQKKIILSEDEVDDLFDNDAASIISSDFINLIKDDNVIFQEDTAVVHMSGNHYELGKILKTNKATSKVFGYSPEELSSAHVEILMPNIIAHKHSSYLNSHIVTGKAKVLYNQKKTFGKDKNGHILPLWLIVKQLNNIDGQINYAGLLRPILQEKDDQNSYMLLNNFGEINGVTKNLSEFLHLPKNLFAKTDINLLLMAPKLIKHFFFAKILQNEKYTTQAGSSFNFEGPKTANPFQSYSIFRAGMQKISPFMGAIGKKNPMKGFMDLDHIKEEGAKSDNEENDPLKKEEDEEASDNEGTEDKDGNMEVEFTLRVPKDLRIFVREFSKLKSRHHDLLNNQQLILDAIHSKSIAKNVHDTAASQASPTLSPLSKTPFKNRKKIIGHLANFKHAVDAYVGALRFVAEKIARYHSNNVYRVRGLVVTDHYGPDRDVVKYIKILEIVKKQEKFTRLTELDVSKIQDGKSTSNLKNASGTSNIIQWNNSFSHNSVLKGLKKPLKMSNYVTQRGSEEFKFNQAANEDLAAADSQMGIPLENSKAGSDSPKGTPKSKTMKRQDSMSGAKRMDSSKTEKQDEEESEGQEGEGSGGSSERQEIMNELKNNILTHYQSIYQKEDNLTIDKNFVSLNNVKWFIRVLFFVLIPLNLIIYFVGPFRTYKKLEESVRNIYTNEDNRRNYIRCHNAITTVLLDNEGYFDTLKTSNPTGIASMLAEQLSILHSSYTQILEESSIDEWTVVLYRYAPTVASQTTVDFEGSFNGAVVEIENAIQKLTNSLFQITLYDESEIVGTDSELQFYRYNSFEKFNKILGGVTTNIFSSSADNFDSTENLSIIILILEGLLFFISFWFILRLILVVIWSLREILVIFTAIDNKQISETEKYYRRLLEYLEVSNRQYFTMSETFGFSFGRRETVQSKSLRYGDDQKLKSKKFKKVNAKDFMRKDTINILAFYLISIILCFCLSVIFHFQSKLTSDAIQEALSDGEEFIQLNPIYISSLIGLKELYYNQTTYEKYNQPYMEDDLSLLEHTITTTVFKSDLEFVQTFKSIMDANPCATYESEMDSSQYTHCESFALGRLATGLINFHSYYSNLVYRILTLSNQNNFGDVGPEEVYEFGQLINIIDTIFMEETLSEWRDNMNTYLNSKERYLAILIAIVSVLNVLVYFVAREGVVGILNKRFLFYRKIYNDYMLAEAPVKEKRIKAVLVKYKLLNK